MRNNAASIIGNGVISLLWQLRCHCNPDHDKFSSLSNTTVVAIFPNVCLWQRIVYAQTWQLYIDPENLYWGTFVCQYAGLCCCIVWPLFLFDCFVKIWAICKNFLGKWSTAPLAENCQYAYGKESYKIKKLVIIFNNSSDVIKTSFVTVERNGTTCHLRSAILI